MTAHISEERPLLEVRDFQVELITGTGIIRAVDSVSFSIHRGETVTIIGESGSGKGGTAGEGDSGDGEMAVEIVARVKDLAAELSPATRLFCTSWVFSFTGQAVDLTALGRVCRRAGVTFVVNGSQAVGAARETISLALTPPREAVSHALPGALAVNT